MVGVHTGPNSCPGKPYSHGGQYPSGHQLHNSPVLQITHYPPSAPTAIQLLPPNPRPLANTVPQQPSACNGQLPGEAWLAKQRVPKDHSHQKASAKKAGALGPRAG